MECEDIEYDEIWLRLSVATSIRQTLPNRWHRSLSPLHGHPHMTLDDD